MSLIAKIMVETIPYEDDTAPPENFPADYTAGDSDTLPKLSSFRRFFGCVLDNLVCSTGRDLRYKRISSWEYSEPPAGTAAGVEFAEAINGRSIGYDMDSDNTVALKISILGDRQIGKTTFLMKYVGGDEEEKRGLQMRGVNLMEKTLCVEGARICVGLWDVTGDKRWLHQIPMACNDAVAILFMFDLTCRTTLNSVIGWYNEGRKWNQSAISILVGTKFDDFVKLPPDLQWTIVTQARGYAKAMNATLFFSSATHNINVNKIFKFIMANLFNLPWTVQRNLTLGEPIIDF